MIIGIYDADWDSVEHSFKTIDAGFHYTADIKVYYPWWAIKVRRSKKVFRREMLLIHIFRR